MLLERLPDLNTRPVMENRRIQIYLALMVSDAAILLGSFLLAGGLWLNRWPSDFALDMGYALLPLFLVIAVYQRCYSIASLDSVRFSIGRVAVALLVSAMLCMVVIFYSKASEDFSRVTVSLALMFSFAAMSLVRLVLGRAIKAVYGPKMSTVIVIQDGGPALDIEGAEIVSLEEDEAGALEPSPRTLDGIGRKIRGMDRVIISCTVERRSIWAMILRGAGVRGEVVSEAAHELGALALEREGRWSFLLISTGPLALHARIFKRAMDIAITVPLLILLSPLLLLMVLLIKLEDGGPVFFVQQRMGQSNCLFNMLKFRSMRHESGDCNGDRSTARGDARVTRIGAFMRRTSIDELPQLINVLRSEMSLVGPRPHALGSTANEKLFWEVDQDYWQRHSLKPGLTGLAQVRGHRGATETEDHLTDRLRADLEYIRTWSLMKDIRIILATARVLIHPNAF